MDCPRPIEEKPKIKSKSIYVNLQKEEEEGLDTGKRLYVKNLINKLVEDNPGIDDNIFKALDNIDLNCILGTRKDGVYKSFMDDYDK